MKSKGGMARLTAKAVMPGMSAAWAARPGLAGRKERHSPMRAVPRSEATKSRWMVKTRPPRPRKNSGGAGRVSGGGTRAPAFIQLPPWRACLGLCLKAGYYAPIGDVSSFNVQGNGLEAPGLRDVRQMGCFRTDRAVDKAGFAALSAAPLVAEPVAGRFVARARPVRFGACLTPLQARLSRLHTACPPALARPVGTVQARPCGHRRLFGRWSCETVVLSTLPGAVPAGQG